MNHDPAPITIRHVIIGTLLIATALVVVALFAVPITNTWFWPLVGLLVVLGTLSMVIRLPKKG